MDIPKIHESEYRFCLILWENEPVSAPELVRLCQERLGWKRTTTYTVIKRLGQRGVLKNENAVVTSLVSKDQVQAAEIDELWAEREESAQTKQLLEENKLPNLAQIFTRNRYRREDNIAVSKAYFALLREKGFFNN